MISDGKSVAGAPPPPTLMATLASLPCPPSSNFRHWGGRRNRWLAQGRMIHCLKSWCNISEIGEGEGGLTFDRAVWKLPDPGKVQTNHLTVIFQMYRSYDCNCEDYIDNAPVPKHAVLILNKMILPQDAQVWLLRWIVRALPFIHPWAVGFFCVCVCESVHSSAFQFTEGCKFSTIDKTEQ